MSIKNSLISRQKRGIFFVLDQIGFNMKKILLVLLLLGGAGTAAYFLLPMFRTYTITGTLNVIYFSKLAKDTDEREGKVCSSFREGEKAENSVDVGSSISLRDSKSELLSTTTLNDGIIVVVPGRTPMARYEGYLGLDCQTNFEFANVKESSVYQIEVGTQKILFNLDELKKKNWKVELRYY